MYIFRSKSCFLREAGSHFPPVVLYMTKYNAQKVRIMVFIHKWIDVDPLDGGSGIQSLNPARERPSPIYVHRILLKNLTGPNRLIMVTQLANELNFRVEDLLPPLDILHDLKLVELDGRNEKVWLTETGKFANLGLYS